MKITMNKTEQVALACALSVALDYYKEEDTDAWLRETLISLETKIGCDGKGGVIWVDD